MFLHCIFSVSVSPSLCLSLSYSHVVTLIFGIPGISSSRTTRPAYHEQKCFAFSLSRSLCPSGFLSVYLYLSLSLLLMSCTLAISFTLHKTIKRLIQCNTPVCCPNHAPIPKEALLTKHLIAFLSQHPSTPHTPPHSTFLNTPHPSSPNIT